eukprot:scaffold70848_cov15-Tisochrysis_lutea.AAC.1
MFMINASIDDPSIGHRFQAISNAHPIVSAFLPALQDPSSHHRRHSAKLTKLPCSQDLSQTELSDWNFGSAASKTTAQGR